MEQFKLKPAKGSTKNRKRIGRGAGSGQGCTAGRGMNGQRSRSGSKRRPWFEGGQMPLQRRVPKRGFVNVFRKEWQIVNLEQLNKFQDGAEVTAATLKEAGLVRSGEKPVKLLAKGELKKKLQVKVQSASKVAADKVAAAGGSFTQV